MCLNGFLLNLLSFFSLVFADGFLRSTRTVRVILEIFIQAWTTRASCRFLPSACIVIATNLKDFRMSLILENKILKNETLKTTRKSSLYFTPREQCFHRWRLVLAASNDILRSIQRCDRRSVCISPPLDHPQTDFHPKYGNLPRIR